MFLETVKIVWIITYGDVLLNILCQILLVSCVERLRYWAGSLMYLCIFIYCTMLYVSPNDYRMKDGASVVRCTIGPLDQI